MSKRRFETVVAIMALTLAAPILRAVAVAIKLRWPGPVSFDRDASGRMGARFTCTGLVPGTSATR
jgi:lipopolysaccharide/colanic/teichoic acid biosynthesis glycosyltransferase